MNNLNNKTFFFLKRNTNQKQSSTWTQIQECELNVVSKFSLNRVSALNEVAMVQYQNGAWKSAQTHLYFVDLNFFYLTNALNQDVISVDHVERSAEDPVCLGHSF